MSYPIERAGFLNVRNAGRKWLEEGFTINGEYGNNIKDYE